MVVVSLSTHGQTPPPNTYIYIYTHTNLQHDGAGLEGLHDLADDGAEDSAVGVVVHTVVEGEVDGVVLPFPVPRVLHVAGACGRGWVGGH